MGALGSGTKRGERTIRPILEEHLCIKILELEKNKLLEPGIAYETTITTNIYHQQTLSILTCEDSIFIKFDHLASSRTQEVKFTRTNCNYGGTRPWFICGTCGSKRSAIYLGSDGLWACRECLGLAYHVQRLNTHERHAHMAAKLQQKKLGVTADKPYLLTERPFRMWRTTHLRILDEIMLHQQKSHRHFQKWFHQLLCKADSLHENI